MMSYITTNDKVRIHYEVEGKGKPLVMIHGWDQSAKAFCKNVPILAKKYQVITIDMRGHGESDKPTYGYRISRLAMDVKTVMDELNLKDAVILGWSMGCSVVWSYWDLFRTERISKIILVDEPPLCLINEGNQDGFADNPSLVNLEKAILDNPVEATKGFVDMMLVTEQGKKEYGPWVLEESLKFPPTECTFLLRNHVYTDWRDVIPTITLPTLVIAAKKSHVKVANNEWTHKKIKGSRLELLETAHMMFLEEPDKFNAIIEDFIG